MEGLERPLESAFLGGMAEPVPPEEGINDEKIRSVIEETQGTKAYWSKEPEVGLQESTDIIMM